MLAHQKLGNETILAEVVTCSRKEAYLQSLVENTTATAKHYERDANGEISLRNDIQTLDAELGLTLYSGS